ncbi:secreted phosphoprotein 24 [Trichechus manatus latirostris]|uniref:Secreted phosphoprotein 24 n=1 Tax=Trichechus manatus latirostris TaxID=127582 RepID=A0A2Y9EBD5_TRIMA|nr:secreted phosphoprotein 24 [Trichechus manatus latirostris]
MEKMMVISVVFVLGMGPWSCSGFPVYDYDPSSLKEALSASVAKVNSQALSPYLFRAFRSSIKRVNVVDEDSLNMDLEFSIRETVCRRDSGENPTTCDFQRGYFVPVVVCRSSVKLSAQQVRDVWVQCHWSSSSESNSREEMIFEDMRRSYRWRNYYPQGLIPEETSSEQFHERSPETMRRFFPPGNRRYPARQYRERTYIGFA